jgi:putative signal transducing protein
MKLVTIFSAFNAAEAHLVRARLEAAEFHPIISNEMTALMLPLYSTVGTVHVQVPEDEVKDARELLAAGDTSGEAPPS